MNIKSKIYISIVIMIIFILGILISVTILTKNVNDEREIRIVATAITKKVFDLNSLTGEFLLYEESRVIEQWNSSYKSGLLLFDKEHPSIVNLQTDYVKLEEKFNNIVNSYNYGLVLEITGRSKEEIVANKLLHNRLVSQLLIASQSLVTESTTLEVMSQRNVLKIERKSKIIGVSLLMLLFAFFTIFSIKLVKDISIPLSEIIKVSSLYAKGKLNTRLIITTDDEFKILGDSLNKMSANLRKQTKLSINHRKKMRLEQQKQIELQEKVITSERRLKTIFEHTSDALFLIDIDHWNFIDFNLQAQLLSGYSADQILQLPVLELFTKNQSAIIGRELQNCTIGMRASILETDILTINDEIVPIECSISTADVEGTNYVIISMRDIRAKKGAIAERERLQKTREQIFINTSHELKTPLTSIIIQSEMLANQELGSLTREQKESIDLILRNVHRFSNLIGAILDISKINAGTVAIHIEKMDLLNTVKEQITKFTPIADLEHVTLVNNIKKINVFSDVTIITRVLTILIENAIKFSKNGTVTLDASTVKDGILVSISDTGLGISKEYHKRVFEPFFQVTPSFALSNKGTGLGLSIASGLVKQIGGRIWVESDGQSKGSVFKFTIPLKITNS